MDLWCPQPYYVDKSKLIKVFLHSHDKIIAICAPQGFLKTTNMLMLMNFIDGISDPAVVNRRKRLWLELKLKIMKHDHLVDTYFGQSPFIYLDFGPCTSSACAILSLTNVIRDQYERNSKIVSGNRLSPAQRVTFQIYRNYVCSKVGGVGERKMADAVRMLCEMLCTYYERPVYVFVDNYDVPVLESLAAAKPLRDVQPFLGQILAGLWASKAVKKVLLNGVCSSTCVPATGCGDFRIAVCPFLDDHQFSKYYGFTEKDVVRLCRRSRCSDEITQQMLSRAYCAAGARRKVYSPEWLLDALKLSLVVENSTIRFEVILQREVMTTVSMRVRLTPLEKGRAVKVKSGRVSSHADLLRLNRLLNGSIIDLDDDEVELVTRFLFELGMFSYVEKGSTLSGQCFGRQSSVKIKMSDTSRMAASLKQLSAYNLF